VDEEETRYIHVLLFSALLENTNCDDKPKYRNKTVLKKPVPNIIKELHWQSTGDRKCKRAIQ